MLPFMWRFSLSPGNIQSTWLGPKKFRLEAENLLHSLILIKWSQQNKNICTFPAFWVHLHLRLGSSLRLSNSDISAVLYLFSRFTIERIYEWQEFWNNNKYYYYWFKVMCICLWQSLVVLRWPSAIDWMLKFSSWLTLSTVCGWQNAKIQVLLFRDKILFGRSDCDCSWPVVFRKFYYICKYHCMRLKACPYNWRPVHIHVYIVGCNCQYASFFFH